MRLSLAILFTLVSFSLLAGEIVLQGIYRGKDLYIKNPYDPDQGRFCTDKVFVNDELSVETPRASAFRVDLSHLRMGAIVVVRIEFQDGCLPQVINPQVLQESRGFRFLSARATNNAVEWATEGEAGDGHFVVERETWDFDSTRIWEDWKEIESKGELGRNSYNTGAENFPGENKYRIRYVRPEQEPAYSVALIYTSTVTPITFSPVSVTTRIELSESTYYEVADRNGKLLKSGTGKTIQLQELKPGEYFLKIQNRIERFVKK